MTEPKHKSRRWQRLPLAFPVFVHSTGLDGRPILEFGTAVNVSAGGILVALKKVPEEKHVLLEMPVPPGFPAENSFRTIESTIVRTVAGPQHTYVGMQFKSPLPC
ncbi:MAG TPA: PilZ domain-containing protein [Terriglobales bacterium]|nr:PilZ domain-containing protein [Terriglobales bacterium]